MTMPIDLINGALLDIGARAAGEQPAVEDANEAFIILNQMIDQWSNESMMIFAKHEVIHKVVGGKFIYTIGDQGDINCNFTGSIAGNILTVTGITSGAISVGQNLTGTGILAGTSITSLNTGRGGNNVAALGTYQLTMNQTVASQTIVSYASRPIKINSAFVRVVNSATGTLDYPIAVINLEKYELIGIKTLPGPWPRALYYQPSEPMGVLNYWPNPSQGEVHLFTDAILNQFQTVNDVIQLPQGHEMAIRRNLAMYLMPGYGKLNPVMIDIIEKSANRGKALIKRTNMAPIQTASFESAIVSGKRNDAGFIMHGNMM